MLKILVATFVVALIYASEHVRIQHAYYDCIVQTLSDGELIERDVCRNPDDRIRFKDTVDCDGAERRLRMSNLACTLHSWASQSSVSGVYAKVTESYWTILGIVLPIVMLYLYLWNQRKMQGELVKQFKRINRKNSEGRELVRRFKE